MSIIQYGKHGSSSSNRLLSCSLVPLPLRLPDDMICTPQDICDFEVMAYNYTHSCEPRGLHLIVGSCLHSS